FADLGLVVVDEQHRFGVEQRDALRTRSQTAPHLLVMTATPIPRTVAMTVFGDLKTSVLTELPAGRAGITTHVVPADNPVYLARTLARIREEVDAGQRVFIVCPRINPDDDDGSDLIPEEDDAPKRRLRSVRELADSLASRPELAGVGIGVLHGQLPPADKEAAMGAFIAGQTPVLVSTTVIEVGVDVPAATLMVVFDADRFGLAQLHQLRGRVGRGSAPGLCLLVSSAPPGSHGERRVQALAGTNDGFELAETDLLLRAEGDVLGAAQSGRTRGLKLLQVFRDADLIEQARQAATAVAEEDPHLEHHPTLRAALAANLSQSQAEFLERG
ncbi:MAG: ATP-dependent DNA helicase RecG, partial [Promicromonosporaceae bacterium]|nr:ATP-dependent DNA helicase RecG [Promicromonosporaceae bacterium]